MPVYDFKCPDCNSTVERTVAYELIKSTTCLECGNVMNVLPVLTSGTHNTFPAGMWEHLADKDLNITNKQQLKDACEEHQCYAPGALD